MNNKKLDIYGAFENETWPSPAVSPAGAEHADEVQTGAARVLGSKTGGEEKANAALSQSKTAGLRTLQGHASP